MSYYRVLWKRDYSDIAKKRIENDECPACGKPKLQWSRRRDWTCCSRECSKKFYEEEMQIKTWRMIRKKVFERDNYTCRYCGRQYPVSELVGDHIIPIAAGGSEFDLDNVQTLCVCCHKIKTKNDACILALHRRHGINIKKAYKLRQIKLI